MKHPLHTGDGRVSIIGWSSRAVGAGAAILVLAACSSSGAGSAGYGGGAAPSETGRAAGGGVAVERVSGVGAALVDGSGMTMYFTDQDEGGSIACTGACLGFWFPVPGDAGSAASSSVDGLDVLHRSDNGMDQLTYRGKPLYTFKLDTGPGQGNGDNLTDSFGGDDFTWHTATTAGQDPDPAAPPAAGASSDPGGGYGY